MQNEPNMFLHQNIQLLNTLFFKILNRQTKDKFLIILNKIFDSTAGFRKKPKITIKNLQILIQTLTNDQLFLITRVFSHFLHLIEITELYHRVYRRQWYKKVGYPPQPGSFEAIFPALINGGISPNLLFKTVSQLNIELVLTAHPTEINRPILIRKYHKIAMQLAQLEKQDLSPLKQKAIIKKLETDIKSAWQTEEIRHTKPTAIDEAKWGLSVIKESLWYAIPSFIRDLNKILLETTGHTLPIGTTPIHLASWMGGDRDGNSNVTAKVTQEVVFLARATAIELYLQDIRLLKNIFSKSKDHTKLNVHHKKLSAIEQRLIATKHWVEVQLEQKQKLPAKKGYSQNNQR
jgi:phosphoenolpyruvate carboxylase